MVYNQQTQTITSRESGTKWRLTRKSLDKYTQNNCYHNTSFASMTVPTPTVRDCLGTWSMSLSKKRALAVMVSWLSVFTRVLDTSEDPGSLNAMWPSGPIPETNQFKYVINMS